MSLIMFSHNKKSNKTWGKVSKKRNFKNLIFSSFWTKRGLITRLVWWVKVRLAWWVRTPIDDAIIFFETFHHSTYLHFPSLHNYHIHCCLLLSLNKQTSGSVQLILRCHLCPVSAILSHILFESKKYSQSCSYSIIYPLCLRRSKPHSWQKLEILSFLSWIRLHLLCFQRPYYLHMEIRYLLKDGIIV